MINSVEPLETMTNPSQISDEETTQTVAQWAASKDRAERKAHLKAEKAAQQQKDLEANLAAATAELPWTILSLMAKARELRVDPILERITYSEFGEAVTPDRFSLTLDTSHPMGGGGVKFSRRGPQTQSELSSLESDLWDAKEFLIEVQRLKDEEKRVRERKAELLASLSQDDLEILGLAPKPTTSRW
jgi:hypothetical protein